MASPVASFRILFARFAAMVAEISRPLSLISFCIDFSPPPIGNIALREVVPVSATEESLLRRKPVVEMSVKRLVKDPTGERWGIWDEVIRVGAREAFRPLICENFLFGDTLLKVYFDGLSCLVETFICISYSFLDAKLP